MAITHKPKAGALLTGTEYEAADAHTGTPAELDAHLVDAADAHDASSISVFDEEDVLTAVNVEAALLEIAAHRTTDPVHVGVLENVANKGVADGYAPLDSEAVVPDANIPTTIARDTEVTTAVSTHAGQLHGADRPPTSPGTYDEEFVGTADTLPANWAWTAAPSGSDAWFLNSRWPSLLTVEGTANTSYTLTRTSFTADATFGIWAKIHVSPLLSADISDVRLYVSDSATTARRAVNLRVSSGGITQGRGLKVVAGVESAWGSAVATGAATALYVGMTRASDSWVGWASLDGIGWFGIAAADSQTFTVDRIIMVMRTSTTPGLVGVDWVRYRTDNAFPRP